MKKNQFKLAMDRVKTYLSHENYAQAINSLEQLELTHSNDPLIKLYLGTALAKCQKYCEAIVVLKNGIKISDNLQHIHYALGVSYFGLQQYRKALNEFRKEIKLNSQNPIPYCESAYSLYELKKYKRAIIFLKKTIQLDRNYADAYHCMAASLNNIEQSQEALPFILKAIELDASRAEYYFDAANIFFSLRKKNEAIAFYKKAIRISPSYKSALYNKGIVHLAYTEFDLGWPLYELRPNLIDLQKKIKVKNFETDLIDSEKKILILKEQGVGDQILFSSLLKDFEQNKNIYMEADQRLLPVLKRSFKQIRFEEVIDDVRSFDCVIPLGSIGGALKKNSINLKSRCSQFLYSDLNKTKLIRKKFLEGNNLLKICGFSWMSYNDEIGKSKSIKIENLLELLRTPNIVFVCLQYGLNKKKMLDFFYNHSVKIIFHDDIDLYNDLDSLFSLIDACDFIVSVSNINAHVAGSLAKKTYLLAPFSKGRHWYWHDGLKESLWYPSVEIFTQNETGDWTKPISDIKEQLMKQIDHE